MKAFVTAATIAGLIALMGWAGTPEYVLDVERENAALRAELKRARLVSAECGQFDDRGLLVQVAE